MKERIVRPRSGSIARTLNLARTPGSKRKEFVRRPVRYAVITTMYTEVTNITGRASQRSRRSPFRALTPTTNTVLIPVVRTRNARSFDRITVGTPTGRVA